ncbi:uncharacterized protein LOC106139863 [Amyelois transitella]|uniref:uncharacterized protein LOC106139863 n=1 Tax=Amyelois transitella TaxID=680683 RepID=UPI00298FBC93|nr:uncharacterized protein LOC106139863 [Amyelois transitella]
MIRGVIMMLTIAVAVATNCPQHCECKWRNGKDAVICHRGSFTTIPTGLLSSTQLLDVSGNRFPTLKDNVFNNSGLLNLQRLYLSKCNIRVVQQRAFWGLKNLVELDLTQNKLTNIPTLSFSYIKDLRDLKLDGNPISILSDDAFGNLRDLVRLTLNSCQISKIESKSFLGLESSLQYLELSKNLLKFINVNVLAPLRALKEVTLSENPWECTCLLKPMREWMIKKNVPITITPECALPPRLRSQPWNRIDLDDFACIPDVKVLKHNVKGLEGSDIVLSCKVSGMPAPRVRWYRTGRLIANFTSNTGKSYVIHIEGQTSNLTIKSADIHDAGLYTCYAENRAGKGDVDIELTIEKSSDVHFKIQGLIAGITITAVIIVCSCLIGVCILESRKGGRLDRFNEQIVVTYQNDEVRLHNNKRDTELTITPTDISRKRGDYRNVPSHDPEDGLFRSNNTQDNISSIVTPLLPSIHRPQYESRSYVQKPENDLHIPLHSQSVNTTSQQPLLDKLNFPMKMTSDYYNNNSKSYNRSQPHGISYSHISNIENERNYPDLIEMNSFEIPFMRDEIKYEPHYFTIRRRKDGSSCSPLLNSRRNSSGGDSNSINERSFTRNRQSSWNRRSNSSSDLTIGSNRSRHNPSLPASPTRERYCTPSATPLLDVSSLHKYSRANYARTTEEFEFRVLQLEHFLDEYRTIGSQLYTSSKETKDNLQRSRPIVSEESSIMRGQPYVARMSPSLALPDAASPLTLNASDLSPQPVPEKRSMYLT